MEDNDEHIALNLIYEYYAMLELERQGPDVTRKALGFIPNLSETSSIADIGCGSGGQTMVLAQSCPGRITGVDLFDMFIHLFNGNAGRLGLEHRVQGITGSMDALPFADGYIAVSEVSKKQRNKRQISLSIIILSLPLIVARPISYPTRCSHGPLPRRRF